MNLCTYFDQTYLPQGLALLRSIHTHEPQAQVFVLCLDNTTLDSVCELGFARLTVVPLAVIETAPLRALKYTRTWREYIFTLTAPWVTFLIDFYKLDSLAYLDADCWLRQSLAPLYDEVGAASVAIIPHRWTPSQAARLRSSGLFNVGWVYFKNDLHARMVLNAWQADGFTFRGLRGTTYSDQLHLNTWPDMLGNYLHVVYHLGANLAPWSQEQYTYLWGNERLFILHPGDQGYPRETGWPVLFYHFHGWRSRANRSGYRLNPLVLNHLYLPYEQEVLGDSHAQ